MKKVGWILGAALLMGVSACKAKQPNKAEPEISIQAATADKYLNIDGLKVRYKVEGTSDKPTLVLLHGFTSSLESWDSFVTELEGNYRIIRLDLPGHGLTGPDPKHRYGHENFVNAVHGLVKELNLDKPILIGNSMGGNTAWRYAAQYPEDISGLVLIDASGFPLNGLSDEPLALPPMLESYFLKPTKYAVNYGLKNQYADAGKIPKGRADKILEMMNTPGNGEAFVEIYKGFTLPNPTAKLSKITAPTLIIWGEKDGVVPADHGELFHSAITNSKLNIIENSGHVSHEENPAQTANLIHDFLSE